jgi:hypothetical protein
MHEAELLETGPAGGDAISASLSDGVVQASSIASYLKPKPKLGVKGVSLNLSEWVHVATQGRDHYVRIVYEGFVYPFRHRAALVKVTERKIRELNGIPYAHMAQRMFVVIRNPLMDYSKIRAGDEPYGRKMPFSRIRLTTLITPDIEFPTPLEGTDCTFWIEVGNEPFRFNAVGEDIGGNRVDFTAALLFVPFSDYVLNTVETVAGEYIGSPKVLRECPVPGQNVTYAPKSSGPDNTTLTTKAIYFDTKLVSGPDGAFAYHPLLFKAEVNLPAVEMILGKKVASEIDYYQPYLAGGFGGGNEAGVFAVMVKEEPVGADKPPKLTPQKVAAQFAAEQAGGIATPDLSISALARSVGPVAGDDLAAVASNTFTPADFFKDMKASAKLFGTIDLADLLVGGSMQGDAPKVQHQPLAGGGMVATIEWKPKVEKAEHGILTLTPHDSVFELSGRIEQPAGPGGVPGPPKSSFNGSLTNFDITFLNVVILSFKEFAFTSATGTKTRVSVDLDGQPKFIEDLEFVNKLREVIPPDLFGGGASLDIDTERVRAGFEIAVPPLSVGVFSLQNLTLSAGLELPFVTGLPLFDFNVSSREHPFNLTVAFLGGGGFFHLQIDTGGMRQLEVALEFGASCSINLGVASGGVYIMAGIYFAMGKNTDGEDSAILSGYLRLGGELSVLGLISVSLEFNLSFGYENKKAAGRATLTVEVEVLCFSKSVEITVEKKFGGSAGDPKFIEVFDQPQIWSAYAGAFA